MARQGARMVLLLVSGLLASPLIAAPVNTPLPGGLADLTGRTGYIASTTGGIEAIDLMTGNVLWSTIEAQVPLAVADERLYAQAGTKRNRLRVLVFDVSRKGEVLLESDPVVFPDWVITGEAPGQTYKANWKLERDALVLSWEARAWYHGKERSTPQLEAEGRKQAEGKVRIELATGKVQHLSADPVTVSLAPEVPIKDLEKKAVRWQGVVGGQYKAVILQTEGEQQKLLLHSWDRTGKMNASPRELIRGKDVTLLPTIDERVLGVREVPPSPDHRTTNNERDRYAWTLYSVESGEVVARVFFDPSTQAMIVLGSRLFVLQGGPITGSLTQPFQTTRILRAIDLKTGRMLWQRPIASKSLFPPPER
jgi:hypothetical protein